MRHFSPTSFFRKYKTQPEAHVPLDKVRFFKASLRVLFNQTIVSIPFTIFMYHVGEAVGRPDLRSVTSFQKLMFDLVVMGLVYEFGFYYSVRKHPSMFAKISRNECDCSTAFCIIAEFTSTFTKCTMSGQRQSAPWLSMRIRSVRRLFLSCQWIVEPLFPEHIFSNLLPVILSIIAVNGSVATSWVWLTMTIITTLGDHSGYHLPFLHRQVHLRRLF